MCCLLTLQRESRGILWGQRRKHLVGLVRLRGERSVPIPSSGTHKNLCHIAQAAGLPPTAVVYVSTESTTSGNSEERTGRSILYTGDPRGMGRKDLRLPNLEASLWVRYAAWEAAGTAQSGWGHVVTCSRWRGCGSDSGS